jgi:Cdc6-like AAA superfamily ATPase
VISRSLSRANTIDLPERLDQNILLCIYTQKLVFNLYTPKKIETIVKSYSEGTEVFEPDII